MADALEQCRETPAPVASFKPAVQAIRVALERSGHRDQFELVTRWAARPLDLLNELRKLKPTVVHFSGHGGSGELRQVAGSCRDIVGEFGGDSSADDSDRQPGLFFQGPTGRSQLVTASALAETLGAAGASVKLVVLNACYSEVLAEALLVHIDYVVGIVGAIHSKTPSSVSSRYCLVGVLSNKS